MKGRTNFLLRKSFFLSFLFLFLLIGLLTPGAISINRPGQEESNPFFAPYGTPFETPPFDRIKNDHFLPAIKRGIELHQAEIEAIVKNPKAPTFDNTILAFDRSGQFLSRVTIVFGALQSAQATPELQKIAEQVSPLITQHRSNIYLNEKLFARIKAVYDQRHKLKLGEEERFLLEKIYQDFVRQGALLPGPQKERLRQIDRELSLLSLRFGNNVLQETNNFKLVIENKKDLEGLPQNVIDMAAETAKKLGLEGKWVFTTQVPSLIPFLQYAKNRELRKRLFTAYIMRGDNYNEYDNKEIIKKIISLRTERAKLLGYPTFAHYAIEVNMAKTPEKVEEFLLQLWNYALKRAKEELAEMQQIADEEGAGIKIEPWDWWYYAEKLRKKKYALEESEIRPYFSIDNVKKGIFTLAELLYGLKFEKRTDISVYHPEVEVYEVKEKDGRHVGLLYLDFFPRPTKRSGAWSGALRRQAYEDGKRIAPISTICCNFTRPTEKTPSLLSLDEVNTFFHEFGHSLATLLANGKYNNRFVPRDGVELPSQIMENWAFEPELLKLYARHYQTGEVIPEELIKKINNSSLFNQGFASTEYLAAALLDIYWHKTIFDQEIDVNSFEREMMKKIGLIEAIVPRYRSSYFQHIFSGGYSAGYYVYIWAEVLDSDAYEAFKERGLFDQKTAALFRKEILEKYGTVDFYKQYIKFRGREPRIEPLLKKRGFIN
ncbi:MAG: M3 family metallopeptidase [Candidatus Aminicenantes bacterium]|nr:M3 family metallopeptidase [Candidatus Aminicenantes bacterium]